MTAHPLSSLLEMAASWAWHTSLAVALPVSALLLLGYWRGFPVRARLWLGALVVIRLLAPVVPAVPWHPSVLLSAAGAASASSVPPPATFNSQGQPIVAIPFVISKGDDRLSWSALLAGLWATGALVVLGRTGHAQWSLHRLIRRAGRPPDDGLLSHLQWAMKRMNLSQPVALREVPGLPTVALWGWRKPCILVPLGLAQDFSADEMRGMFLHELAHVKRRDVLWAWLSLGATALHWFNPLAWLTLRRISADRELDCDRRALDQLTQAQRRAYGLALLKTLETRLVPAPAGVLVPFGQRQPDLHTRIRMIASPLPSNWYQRLALTVLPALAVLTFTTAQADEESKRPEAAAEAAKKDSDRPKEGARDVEGKAGKSKTGDRDGDKPRTGPRDGETKRSGPRDGEGKKSGPRDGEEEARATGDVQEQKTRAALRVAAQQARAGDPVVLSIRKDGTVSSDGQSVGAEQLVQEMKTRIKEKPDQEVILQADLDTPYREVIRVLDLLKQTGAWNVSFASEELKTR